MTVKPVTLVGCLLLFVLFSVGAGAQGWVWGKGNSGSAVDAWPVATDPGGNVFAAGINFGFTQVIIGPYSIPNTGVVGLQCIIAKFDPSGNMLWAAGTQNGNANLISIATDTHGNSFMFGSIAGSSIKIGQFTLTNPYTTTTDAPYFLAKFDPFGTVLWAVTGGNVQNAYAPVGGFAYILGLGGVATDNSGNVYITGNFHRASITIGGTTLTNADPSGKTDDVFLVKYDPSGNVVWAKSAGGLSGDDAYGITVTPAGDIYVAGVFASSSMTVGASVISSTGTTGQTAFIARFDNLGNPVWACGSGGMGGEYAVGVAADADNNVYMTGGLKDSAISLNGTTITNPTPGRPVLYLAKFGPSNNVSWYKTISSVSPALVSGAWGYSIAMSECGVIWVSGAMIDSVVIDGHSLTAPDNSINNDTTTDPVFIAGFTTWGGYVGSAALISGADDQNGIACDATGNVYMCADYLGNLIFTAGGDVLPKNPAYEEILYVTKYASLNSNTIKYKYSRTNFCNTNDVLLSAPQGYQHYEWNDGYHGTARHTADTGTFWVSSSDSCVSYSCDTFCVRNCDCGSLLFVPNTFTPNGDGENDIFYPRCSPGISRIESFRVYNRWGVLVFDRENIGVNEKLNGWDGTYNSQPPTSEVYVWVVDAVCADGSTFNKKGSVTIIR